LAQIDADLTEALNRKDDARSRERRNLEKDFSDSVARIRKKYRGKREQIMVAEQERDRAFRMQQGSEKGGLSSWRTREVRKIQNNYKSELDRIRREGDDEWQAILTEIEEHNAIVQMKIDDVLRDAREDAEGIRKLKEKLATEENKLKTSNASVHRYNNEIKKLESQQLHLERKLKDVEMRFENYAQLQDISWHEVKENEAKEDFELPDPVYFLGQGFKTSVGSGILHHVSMMRYGKKHVVLLYKDDGVRTDKKIGGFLDRFTSGLYTSSDFGVVKNQYIIDVSKGSEKFILAEYIERRVYVVPSNYRPKSDDDNFKMPADLANLKDVIERIEQEGRNLGQKSRDDEMHSYVKYNQLRKADDEMHFSEYNILHIIVPKRDDVDRSGILRNSGFLDLLQNHEYEIHGLLIILYVAQEEWEDRHKKTKLNKTNDILSEIERHVSDGAKYIIDNVDATLRPYEA